MLLFSRFDRQICRKYKKLLQFCRIAPQNNDLPYYKAVVAVL